MCRSTRGTIALALAVFSASCLAESRGFAGVGRSATAAEIKAWDIDVRPDFKGLPKGSGTVEQGQTIWEGKCASCHGTFGESNEVFAPLVGGTTQADLKTGHAATLASPQPVRTTLSKLSAVSTLWDYINRAMPWNAPKSLTTDEVYSVVAYLLNLGEIVPADFTLSDANIREVQDLLPNRNGMTRNHGLWDVKGKADVRNVACMKDCPTSAKIESSLPEHARNNHGNLAEQNRTLGAIRGADTTQPPGARPAKTVAAVQAREGDAASFKDIATRSGCLACHGIANKIVGPGFNEVAARYKGDAKAEDRLVAKVMNGGAGAWGQVPMPPQSQLKEDDAKRLVRWLLSGAN